MNPRPFRLRRAVPADAAILSRLGPATFREAFGAEFPAADVDARMDLIYSRSRLRKDLADPAQAWFLALAGRRSIGFLSLHDGPAPACVTGPRPLEVARVYLRAAWHGRGPAFALMEAGFEEAARRGAGTLWLQAWEGNPKALAFYRAHGFHRAGEVPVRFGGRELPHLVLVRPMAPAEPDVVSGLCPDTTWGCQRGDRGSSSAAGRSREQAPVEPAIAGEGAKRAGGPPSYRSGQR